MDQCLRCMLCNKKSSKIVLDKYNNLCYHCNKKINTVKSCCEICKVEKSKDILDKRNGICSKCHRVKINSKKEPCISCGTEYTHATLEKHEGFCVKCRYNNMMENFSKISVNNDNIFNSNSSIKTFKYERFNNPSCSICLEDWDPNDNINLLACNHYFHENCINKWMLTKNECPICKYKIN